MKRVKILVSTAVALALAGAFGLSYTVWSQSAKDSIDAKSAAPTDVKQTISVTLDPEKKLSPVDVVPKPVIQQPVTHPQHRVDSQQIPKNYFSFQHRAIDVCVFGAGAKTILIMGGVHGNERSGVSVTRSLRSQLDRLPASAFHQRIVLMPLVNPDGYARCRRQNARGIDINRNFPEKGFSAGAKSKGFRGGKKPASEPETQAVLDVVRTYKPNIIISLHAPLACLNYSGPSLKTAKQLSKLTGLPARDDIGYPTPGSMGNFYGCDQGIEVITFELPNRNSASPRFADSVINLLGLKSAKSSKNVAPTRRAINRILICKSQNALYAYSGSQLLQRYPVSTGRGRTWTPEGSFRVTNKTPRAGGQFGTRWLGLNVRGKYRGLPIGIHGTNSPQLIGRSVSHGCIRLRNADVEELFANTPVGTSVRIVYGPVAELTAKLSSVD